MKPYLMKIQKNTGWALLLTLVLTACATRERYDQQHADNVKRVNAAMSVLQQTQPRPQFAIEDKRLKLAVRSIPLGRDAALPENIRSVTFRTAERMSLKDIAERLSRELQILVLLSPELRSEADAGLRSAGQRPAGSETGDDKSMVLNFSGSLSDLLDHVAILAQVQWKYENNRIEFYRHQTTTYVVKAFPGDFKITSPLSAGGAGGAGGTGGGAGGSGGGGGISGNIDSATEFWQGFEAGLKTLLSDKAKIALDKNAGLLVLTDSYRVHEQVEKYIAQVNTQLMRQISLDVEIITIDMNQDSSQGIDWGWINSTLQSTGQINTFKFASPPTTTATAAGNTPFTVNFSSSAGRTAMLQLLQAFGKVSTAYSGILVTTNRTAVPVSVNNTLAYLAQTTPAVSTSGSTTLSSPGLTPGQVTTGTNVTLLPLLLDSNQVLLQSVVRLSSLQALTRFDSGQGTNQQSIQLPSVDSFTTVQRVVVPSGQTMVMMGYDRVRTSTSTTGPVENVSTNKSTTGSKQSVVLMVTPRLVDL